MPTILLVEDQSAFRDNLAEALEDQGFSVVRAASAEEASASLVTRSVDLLLLDVALPGKSGIDFLRSMRSMSTYRRVPAFFLTAHARPEAMEEAARLGVGGFLVKSDVSLRDLLERIQNGLSLPPDSRAPSTTDHVEARRHLRPALRRWKAAPQSPQCRDLFALCDRPADPGGLREYLSIDPAGSRWLRRISPRLELVDPPAALRLLVMRAVVDSATRSVQPGHDVRRLWRRSLATGLLAEACAGRRSFGSPTGAFLAGFCSQIPWIFAVQALEGEYPEVKARAWEEERSITAHLAGVFGTDETTLAMETLRGLELPDRIWQSVLDLRGPSGGPGIWEPGPGGRVLAVSEQLSAFIEPIWHPCAEVRGVGAAEAAWLEDPNDVAEAIGWAKGMFREIAVSDAFPEAVLAESTRMVPVSAGCRRIAYMRAPDALAPDPLEAALSQIGNVETVGGSEELLSREDCTRVAWAEPGTSLWDRIHACPRRALVLHHKELPRGAGTSAHSHLRLPATLAALERAVRGRE